MSLITGTVISFTDGTTGTIESKIGEGGQGEVYKIRYHGKSMALKWYKNRPSQNFVSNLEKNVKRQAPAESFLWPMAVCNSPLGIGYLMELRKESFEEFKKFIYLAEKYRFKDENAIIAAAINLCIAFKQLHSQGLAYFDLNDGNFFFNSESGEVLIADNDNVSPANTNVSNILGTPIYMAPEILAPLEILSKEEKDPDRYTDYHSLAVILFRMIFIDHPFDGKIWEDYPCLTPSVYRKIYGENPIFIFDPQNKENEAVEEFSPNALKRWELVPKFIRNAFIKAFSYECLHNPQSRIMESEWIKIFQRWRAYHNTCPICGCTTDIEPEDRGRCKKCNRSMSILWMQSDYKEYVPLVEGQKIYESQIGLDGYFNVVAEIVGAKNNKNALGIRNKSSFEWMVCVGEQHRIIKSGDAFKLVDNMIIRFNNKKEVKIRLVKPN